MSKKCPHCGSYNTEISIGNYAGRTLLNAGRYALAVGAAMVAGVINPTVGHAAGHSVLHDTDPGDLKGHHCCNCGKDFSA